LAPIRPGKLDPHQLAIMETAKHTSGSMQTTSDKSTLKRHKQTDQRDYAMVGWIWEKREADMDRWSSHRKINGHSIEAQHEKSHVSCYPTTYPSPWYVTHFTHKSSESYIII
jgi:hypothetical protein